MPSNSFIPPYSEPGTSFLVEVDLNLFPMPSFNATHPELQPGEQFYINIEADKAEKVMLHQPVNNPEYSWRLGTKAYTYSGIPIPQRLPLFRKLNEKPAK